MTEPRSGASVSIAMATYNGERFIREQLDSIAAQSLLPQEIVISDDGSTDATLEIVRDFAETAPFAVRILPPHERLGFADNFLHAAEQCHGRFVALSDQDDQWLPDKLAQTTRRMIDDGSLISLHPLIVTDAALEPVGLTWDQGIDADRIVEPLALDPYNTGFGNSMMFDRSVLDLIPRGDRPQQPDRPHLPLAHDHWVYTLCAALGRISFVATPLLRYRQHGSNTYGLKRRPFSNRLYSAITVPEERFREEAGFDTAMAALFDKVGQGDTPFAGPAIRAAATYRQRAFLCEQRGRTYDAPRLSERASAFRNSRSIPFYRPWIGSTLKEVVFGVSGLSRLARRHANR